MSRATEQYLSGEYREKNPSFHTEDSPWKARQVKKMFDLHCITPGRVAEVGCGAGEILVQLAQLFPRASFDGFELSPQGFTMCKSRESDRVKFYNTNLCPGPRLYDVVLCIDVFEHVEDYFDLLRGIRPAGLSFIFHIPLDMNVQMVLRSSPILKARSQVGHLHYFSKDTALATLEDCGYKVHSWFYTPSDVDCPKGRTARLFQFPRRMLFSIQRDFAVRVLGGYSLMVYAHTGNG